MDIAVFILHRVRKKHCNWIVTGSICACLYNRNTLLVNITLEDNPAALILRLFSSKTASNRITINVAVICNMGVFFYMAKKEMLKNIDLGMYACTVR